jgi:cell division protease FtsH
LVRSMVCEWGMTDKLGAVAYDERSEQGQYLGGQGFQEKSYSQDTAKAIDEEVRKILDAAHESAKNIVIAHKDKVQLMADMLMEFESLDRDDVKLIISGEWDAEKKRAKEKVLESLSRKLPPAPGSKETSPKDSSKIYKDPLPQQG